VSNVFLELPVQLNHVVSATEQVTPAKAQGSRNAQLIPDSQNHEKIK
jgi:hypothetical protein